MRNRLLVSLVAILVAAFGGLLGTLIAGNEPALGLDLQGGISVTQQPVGEYSSESLDLAVERIRDRVDSLGVAEPEILRQGETVVVNLPGVKNQREAERLVQVTGQVYLRPVLACQPAPVVDPSATTTNPETGASSSTPPDATDTTLGGGLPASPAATTVPAVAGIVGGAPPETTTPDPAITAPATSAPSGTTTTAPDGATTTTLPGGSTTVPADTIPVTPEVVSDPSQQQILPTNTGEQCLVGPAGGTGEVFEDDARATLLAGSGWAVTVSLRGGNEGEGTWNALAAQCFSGTEACPSRELAIELDGEIISHPRVNESEFIGEVQITGAFDEGEARDLARVLESGSLPVRLEVVSTQNVSPTLGRDSLDAAVISGIVGVGLVLLFMALYYRALGVVVAAGLLVSTAILFSVISLLSRTSGLALSLAGVAGIIVSVGITVDSYVVFFERLKDEVRSGRTMRNGAQRGFAGAWRTIVIADLVSLLGALVLWYLTVGSVRNFAFFLGMSTLCDLFVAYFFTRPTVLLLARTDWMARRKVMGIEARIDSAAAGAT